MDFRSCFIQRLQLKPSLLGYEDMPGHLRQEIKYISHVISYIILIFYNLTIDYNPHRRKLYPLSLEDNHFTDPFKLVLLCTDDSQSFLIST